MARALQNAALILGDTLRNGIRIVIDSKSTFDMIISCDEPPVPKTWLENPPQLKLGFPTLITGGYSHQHPHFCCFNPYQSPENPVNSH
jgi:hypothetical protein